MKQVHTDEQIQKLLDQKQISEQERDAEVRAYQLLYQALGQPPSDVSIPENFSQKMAALAIQQQKQHVRRQSLRWMSVIISSIGLSMLGLYYTYPPFFHYLLAYKDVFIFTIIVFLAVQASDYWLVRKKQLWTS